MKVFGRLGLLLFGLGLYGLATVRPFSVIALMLTMVGGIMYLVFDE